VRAEVVAHYRHFVELNPRALELCTRWQLRTVGGESRPNDHLDLDHDAAVVDDLAGFVADAVPTLHRLGSALDRFGHYPQRLGDAAEQVRNGNTDFVTRPMIDSFHTVWFELHENLLATLGRTRSDELGPNSLVDRPAR